MGEMILHREIDDTTNCGGQTTDGDLFNTDHWCVYCGKKWNNQWPYGHAISQDFVQLLADIGAEKAATHDAGKAAKAIRKAMPKSWWTLARITVSKQSKSGGEAWAEVTVEDKRGKYTARAERTTI